MKLPVLPMLSTSYARIVRKGILTQMENPPDDWEECGGCDCYHPPQYQGDCRDDANRWPA